MDDIDVHVAFVRDITERKRTEETLTREHALLRTFIDNPPDCIYAKDANGRNILANPADWKNDHCRTEAEAIGKNDFDLFPGDIAEKFWADDRKVIQGQPVVDREEYFFNEAGEKRWLLTSRLPLGDESGKILGLVGIGRDITEYKRAEEKIREQAALLDDTTDAIAPATADLDKLTSRLTNNKLVFGFFLMSGNSYGNSCCYGSG